MKRTTNLAGALSSASNSIPVVDLPNAATTSSSRSDEQCGIAIPKPIPVLIVSSRCFSAARIGSRSGDLILPSPTSKSMSLTMAAQRSVAFISGMICSAESKLANDMRISPREIMLQVLFLISVALYFTGEAKLSGSDLDDKRDLPYVASDPLFTFYRALCSSNVGKAASGHRTYRLSPARRGCPGRTCFDRSDEADD